MARAGGGGVGKAACSYVNLEELIRQTRGGRSLRALAEAAPEPSHQRWQQMAAGKPMSEFLKPSTIDSMAEVLGVRPEVVIRACAETLGYSWETEPRLIALLPPGLDDLTDEEVDAVRTMLIAFQTARRLGREFSWEERDAPRQLRAARRGVPRALSEREDD